MNIQKISEKLAGAIPFLTVALAEKIVIWMARHPQVITALRQLVEQDQMKEKIEKYLNDEIEVDELLEQDLGEFRSRVFNGLVEIVDNVERFLKSEDKFSDVVVKGPDAITTVEFIADGERWELLIEVIGAGRLTFDSGFTSIIQSKERREFSNDITFGADEIAENPQSLTTQIVGLIKQFFKV